MPDSYLKKPKPDVYALRKAAEEVLGQELTHEECANLCAIDSRMWTRHEHRGGPRMPDGVVKCFCLAVCLKALDRHEVRHRLNLSDFQATQVAVFVDGFWEVWDPLNLKNMVVVDNNQANHNTGGKK